jgi:hypothetical protein
MKLHLLALCWAGLLAAGALAEDVVTLTDGSAVKGTIIKEDADGVVVQQSDWNLRVLLRASVAKVERAAEGAQKAGEEKKGSAKSDAASKNAQAGKISTDEIKALSSPNLEVRKAAMARLVAGGKDSITNLLGMLNPKFPIDEIGRISVLRCLAQLAPLPLQGSRTLAFVAIHDPFAEVRREACCVIRLLGDEKAEQELGNQAATEDPVLRRALAAALHEIDDPRLFYSLVAAVPPPSTNANVSNQSGYNTPRMTLPVGPLGGRVPVFLPSDQLSGSSMGIDSPVAELLKLIANKNLGCLPAAWQNWYKEKVGASASDGYNEKRSLREIMGLPY